MNKTEYLNLFCVCTLVIIFIGVRAPKFFLFFLGGGGSDYFARLYLVFARLLLPNSLLFFHDQIQKRAHSYFFLNIVLGNFSVTNAISNVSTSNFSTMTSCTYYLRLLLMKRLQKVQLCAWTLYASMEDILKLKWLPVKEHREWGLVKIAHKAPYNTTWPDYLRPNIFKHAQSVYEVI